MPDESQKFKCLECGVEVTYKRKEIPAFTKVDVMKIDGSRDTKTVYLTCQNGHTRPYEVEIEK